MTKQHLRPSKRSPKSTSTSIPPQSISAPDTSVPLKRIPPLKRSTSVPQKPKSIRNDPLHWLFLCAGGLILLFIIAPLAGMFLKSSGADIWNTVTDPEVGNSVWLTLLTAMAATLLFALFAIPLAYFLARNEFPLKRLVLGIIDIPIVIPHSAAGIALLGIISRESALGQAASFFGITLVNSQPGIILAMAFVSLPFLINAAYIGFKEVPARLENTARSLGASGSRVFFTISLPLAWRAIVSGLIHMWARGMSEFGAVIIIAYNPMVTPVLIFERFSAYGLKYARPVAVIFISICLVLFIIFRLISRRNHNAHD